MEQRYFPILHAFPPFEDAAKALLPSCSDPHQRLTAAVTAPVLFTYVWFVLTEAERMGLKRLYFLSRDGYVMRKIAQEISKVCPVGLELRYLYCSRASLRMPTYHRIPEEEAMELLLHRGTNLTLLHILARAECTEMQRNQVYADCGLTGTEERKLLSETEFADICIRLRKSAVFRQIVMENSRRAYASAMPYLEQEGLTDGTKFGIVDSGWTGSMQRSLRQFSDAIPPMTGFYFGMFSAPKSAQDGVYRTWYFSERSSIALRTKFSNNVFECMCAAAHGMTVGYRQEKEGRYAPVFRPPAGDADMLECIRRQITICREFAALAAPHIPYSAFPYREMHTISRKLLQTLMYRPTQKEANAFAEFPFCDDVTEAYTDTLVRQGAASVLKEHMLCRRIVRKMQGLKPSEELFWYYGTLAVSGLRMQALRRLSLRSWDIGRYTIEALRNGRR